MKTKINRVIHNNKRNNRGFSLVEVLVAVLILGIVTIPILKAFTSSAVINKNARKQENANTAASTVLEDFKSLSVEQLKKRYEDHYIYHEDTGIYEFEVANTTEGASRYYAGVNGEEFSVKVTLDPANYTDKVDEAGNPLNNQANNINSYSIPRFTDISSSQNYILRDALYKWDTDAKSTFSMLAHNYEERYIKKRVEISVSVGPKNSIPDSATEAVFVQRVSGRLIYSYTGCDDYIRAFELEDNEFVVKLGADNIYTVSNGRDALKNVYMFYTPFDVYSTSFVANNDPTKCLANDEISISYDYEEKSGIAYENLDVYLVQQNITSYGHEIYLDRSRVSLTVNGNDTKMNLYGTIDLSKHDGVEGPVSVYSNIYGWEHYTKDSADRGNTITSGGSNTGRDYLYSVSVEVWEDEDSRTAGDDALASVTSTKTDNIRR